jgi:ethanolamine transporter
MLLGAFPMVYVFTKVAAKPLQRAGRVLGMGDTAAAGMIATLANNIPMFQLMKDMDVRGKVLNSAFAVSAAFTFGDHLGFTAGVNRAMLAPMIAGKLVAGISAVAVALLFFGRMYPKLVEGEPIPAPPEELAVEGPQAERKIPEPSV